MAGEYLFGTSRIRYLQVAGGYPGLVDFVNSERNCVKIRRWLTLGGEIRVSYVFEGESVYISGSKI
jgi:hypothetical protein